MYTVLFFRAYLPDSLTFFPAHGFVPPVVSIRQPLLQNTDFAVKAGCTFRQYNTLPYIHPDQTDNTLSPAQDLYCTPLTCQ